MSNDFFNAPIDHTSSENLATQGLRLGVVDTADRAAFGDWVLAEARGFHDPEPTPERLEQLVTGLAYRRSTGVWDEQVPDATTPIATVSSWSTPLTVPGSRTVDAWAISAVTVSPTHRRRGIARALLEAELRTANALHAPVAMLTVSEATIYGRYGFAPAVMAADWKIETGRSSWNGPRSHGRVSFITLAELREQGPAMLEKVRLNSPGEIETWPLLWERLTGLATDDPNEARSLRVARFDDVAGDAQGFVLYRVSENPGVVFGHSLEVVYLASATDDAYATLWRYVLELDLVGEVTAKLRSVDEAFAWQVSDFRAVTKMAQRDHLWTRILDVKAALEARRYSAYGSIVLEVSDALGFAEGRFLLKVADDGTAQVEQLLGEIPEDAAAIGLDVGALSAIYLGGVSAVTLTRAGRITELREGSSSAVDASFRTAVTPWLSIWF